MNVCELAKRLSRLAEEHPEADVIFMSLDAEYDISLADYSDRTDKKHGKAVIIYSDEGVT